MHKDGAIAMALSAAIIVGGSGSVQLPEHVRTPDQSRHRGGGCGISSRQARIGGASPNGEIRPLRALGGTGGGEERRCRDARAHPVHRVRGMETDGIAESDAAIRDIEEATVVARRGLVPAVHRPGGGATTRTAMWPSMPPRADREIATRGFGKAGRASGGGGGGANPVDASKNAAVRSFDVHAHRGATNGHRHRGWGSSRWGGGGTYRDEAMRCPPRAVVAFDAAKNRARRVEPTLDISFPFGSARGDRGIEGGGMARDYARVREREDRQGGNRGSMFVLTRDRDTTLPLS